MGWLGLMSKLESFRPRDRDDTVEWTLESSKVFTTKSAFLKLTDGLLKLQVPLVDSIWKFNSPKKGEVNPLVPCP